MGQKNYSPALPVYAAIAKNSNDASPPKNYQRSKDAYSPTLSPQSSPTAAESSRAKPATLFYPIENFTTGITKKPFGIFITPDDATARSGGADDGALATEDSPVQPERFRGYHTGVDVEVPQTDDPIPIFAIADGRVVLSQTASGYGGIVAIRHTINGESILAIYGHLNPTTMAKIGTQVKTGQQIGALGKGFSAETDFERKHLHFGLYRGADNNIKGYVSDKSDLNQWYDPVEFFKKSPSAKP